VESRGKNDGLADYMETLLEERKEADQQGLARRHGQGQGQGHEKRQQKKGGKPLQGQISLGATAPVSLGLGGHGLQMQMHLHDPRDADGASYGLGSRTGTVDSLPSFSLIAQPPAASSLGALQGSSTGSSGASVTSKLKAVTVNTRVAPKNRNQRSALSAAAQKEVDSILRGPSGTTVDAACEADFVLERMSDLSLAQQEHATSALMQDIVRSSKLLSAGLAGDTGTMKTMGTGALPPQLAAFKQGFDKLGKTAVRLPTITSIVDNSHTVPVPRTAANMATKSKGTSESTDAAPQSVLKKRISEMLPPTEEEQARAESILEQSLTTVKRGQIYKSIATDAIRDKQLAYQAAAKARSGKPAGPQTSPPRAEEEAADPVSEGEEELADDDIDLLLAADPEMEEKLQSMGGEARAKAIADFKIKRKAEKLVREAQERKRAANDLRRKNEVKAELEKQALAADTVLFKKNMKLRTDKEGKSILNESSTAFFRVMENKKREAAIKGHMVARLEAEEEEADQKVKQLAAVRAQEEALYNSRPGTTQEESSSIRRDEDGNIIDSDSEQDDEDDFDDEPAPIVKGLGVKLEGAVGSSKRKQSIAMLVQKTESTLVKHGNEKDLMAEMRSKIGPTKKKDKKKKTRASLLLDELEAAAVKPIKTRDFFKSPIHTESHKVAPRVAIKPPSDMKKLAKNQELVGGPLVVGSVNYGIPLGLQLHGSGRHRPFTMDEVCDFQSSLAESPKKISAKIGISVKEDLEVTKDILFPALEGPARPHPYAAGMLDKVPARETLARPVTANSEIDPSIFTSFEAKEDVKTEADQHYDSVARDTKQSAKAILAAYTHHKTRFARQTAKVDKQATEAEEWMDSYKMSLHDELGVDIDAKFLQKKLAERAIRLMMFYILEVQLKNSFTLLRDQTRRVTNARFVRAAAAVNRMGRGLIARQYARARARKVKDRNDYERGTKYKRIRLENTKARVIQRALRLFTKMKAIKRLLEFRRAATTIQRRARGTQGRDYARRVKLWRDWLKINSTMIQCSFRQHLARRKVVLYRKILHVRELMKQWEEIRKEKMRQLQHVGASNTIKRYYRAYKVWVKLKVIIFWNRWGKAISLQRFVRGYYSRKYFKNLMRIKRAKEKRVFDAAQRMQKYVRGANARKLFAGMVLEKKKQRARRRMAKAAYLQSKENMLDVNNLRGFAIAALRGLMPFRYLLLWSRAAKIQRVYRGFRGRRVAFIRKIKTRIRLANQLYFGREKGANHMQRIFRGFKVRRGLIRELRLDAAWRIQCFVRQYIARQAKIFKKIRLDAISCLSRNIFLMLRFKKAMRNKFENKRVAKQTLIIQAMWRNALKRKRMNEVKTAKRMQFEQNSIIQSKITYILSSIQLRLFMEAISRNLGREIPFVASGIPCPANGPTHALFLSAVGPKANAAVDELLSNKLDSTNWNKWLAKIKGVTASGKPADTKPYRRQPVRMDDWQTSFRRQAKLAEKQGKGKGKADGHVASAAPQCIAQTPPRPSSRGKSRGDGSRGGSRGRSHRGAAGGKEEEKETTFEYCTFSLLESVLDGSIATITGGNKLLSSTEVDMSFVKAKADPSHSQLNYLEFMELVNVVANEYYFDFAEEIVAAEKLDEEARAKLAAKMQLEMASSQASVASSVVADVDKKQPGTVTDDTAETGSVSDAESDDNSGSAAVSGEAKKMLENMLKKEEEKAKKLALKEARENKQFNAKSWRAKALLWPIGDISLIGKKDERVLGVIPAPNIRLLMLIKMFDSCRQEPWFIPVSNWIEQESRARLGIYCKRMQNIFWHMKAAFFRTLVRNHREGKILLIKHNKSAKIIQKYARRMVYIHRIQRVAQAFFIKYVPDIGHEYWYNSSTKVTKYSKPHIMGPLDCLSISMPPAGLEFVVKCSNCMAEQAVINCDECEDSFCRPCFDDLHCKGSRRNHHKQKIPMCGYCKFQMACRTCVTCMTVKPEPGSPMELMSETDRGTMCDTCFSHSHNEHDIEMSHASDAKKKAAKQIFNQSKTAYLVAHQLHLRIKTTHKYLDMVQSCEECWSRSAAWRCLTCKQVYCNRCLLGLHSMGGPFAKHKGERLPYYTPEMHQSYLSDQRTQAFQSRMIEVNKLFAVRLHATKLKKVLVLQSWWRMIRGRRVGLAHILATRKAIRRAYRLRQTEEHIRTGWKYKILDALGFAPKLKSDTKDEKILGRISLFGKQFAREYIWLNRDDFGHYKEVTKTKNKVGRVVTKVKFNRKGVPRSGFDVGTLPELAAQARSGGYRLPGYVKVMAGESKFDTTCDLSTLLVPGMLVKLGRGYFKVRTAKATSETAFQHVILDRTWRWPIPVPDDVSRSNAQKDPNRKLNIHSLEDEKNRTSHEVMYRLPVYADEPRRNYYKFMYWATNYAIANPFAQFYFSMHNSLFTKIAVVGEKFEQLYKKLGFRAGAKKWRLYADQQERRARWARNLVNGDSDIADLSAVTKSGKKTGPKVAKPVKPAKKPKKAQIVPEANTPAFDSKGGAAGGVKAGVAAGASMHAAAEGAARAPDHATASPGAVVHDHAVVVAEKAAEEAELAEMDEMAAFMEDEVDYDNLETASDGDDGDAVDTEKPWVATKEQVKARQEAEALLTREDLAAKSVEWSEHVDPMTENVYWLHDETNEMSMSMPASLKMKIFLAEEAAKNKADMDEAMKRMQKTTGNTGAKGKAVFKKKR